MQFKEQTRNGNINCECRRYHDNVNIYFWTSVLNGNSSKTVEMKLRLTQNTLTFCIVFYMHRM